MNSNPLLDNEIAALRTESYAFARFIPAKVSINRKYIFFNGDTLKAVIDETDLRNTRPENRGDCWMPFHYRVDYYVLCGGRWRNNFNAFRYKPSKVYRGFHPPDNSFYDYPWIYAFSPTHDGEQDFTGKWLIFAPLDRLDKLWETIAKDTEAGRLGVQAKVKTADHRAFERDNTRVICVYTRDWRDKADVFRVRDRLRELGFIEKLPYKTDDATRAGIYADGNGHRVSLYYD